MKELFKAKSEFRKQGVTLMADATKSGGGGSWKFASEDNLVKTIQAPLTKCGLEIITTMDYVVELSANVVTVVLAHTESGKSVKSSKLLTPVVPKNDRNGNPMWLDAEIEQGKQFGYWSRILTMRILGLSDVENPENSLQDISDETNEKMQQKRKELDDIITTTKDQEATKAYFLKMYNVNSLDAFTFDTMEAVIRAIKDKQAKENASTK